MKEFLVAVVIVFILSFLEAIYDRVVELNDLQRQTNERLDIIISQIESQHV